MGINETGNIMDLKQIKPIIGLPADRTSVESLQAHMVFEKYVVAITEAVDGLPWLVPAMGKSLDLDLLLDNLDGFLLTGGFSNIEPHRYGAPSSFEESLHDPKRDETTLPLIPKALEKGIPILGICRGIQELNVAFGGSLHQEVHKIKGFNDHRDNKRQSPDIRFGPAHEVYLEPNSRLAQLTDGSNQLVNSLHEQGIDRLADGLIMEAVSSDGLIEAVSVKEVKSFALAVQWHPEWQYEDNAFYTAIFKAFADACKKRALKRR
jgi:putative glutamine amidotransferase